ncbi:MAG: L-amino acid N-acyltransferase YncA [Candidatus Azotimanducaceae bacterium]|jgi:L-amino acid N-acyltransferase YncA
MAIPEHVAEATADYPQTVKLRNGSKLELKPARKGNKKAIVKFANSLDEQDLLFLRVDITQPEVVENWLANTSTGATVSILAWDDNRVVGYATVDTHAARWTRRMGEIRVNVAPSVRGQGLGKHLTGKVFDVARRLGLKKLVAHMTPDQVGAQHAFASLGFRPEALLANVVEDRNGDIHDLIILSYDIEGLSSQFDVPLKV